MVAIVHQGSKVIQYSATAAYTGTLADYCALTPVQSKEPGARRTQHPKSHKVARQPYCVSRQEMPMPTATHHLQSVVRSTAGGLYVFRFDILQATSWPHTLS